MEIGQTSCLPVEVIYLVALKHLQHLLFDFWTMHALHPEFPTAQELILSSYSQIFGM
jgi:hypothetical protein